MSGRRTLDSEHAFYLAVEKKGNSVSFVDLSDNAEKVLLRPTGKNLVVAIAPFGSPVNVRIRLDNSDSAESLIEGGAKKGPRCIIRAAGTTTPSAQGPSALILFFSLTHIPSSAEDLKTDAVSLNAAQSWITAGGISPSDQYASKDDPLASGDVRYIETAGSVAKMRMYGQNFERDYSGHLTLLGDAMSITLDRDSSLQIHGNVKYMYSDRERLSRTAWETFPIELKIFFLGGLAALITSILVKYLVPLLKSEVDGPWHGW